MRDMRGRIQAKGSERRDPSEGYRAEVIRVEGLERKNSSGGIRVEGPS